MDVCNLPRLLSVCFYLAVSALLLKQRCLRDAGGIVLLIPALAGSDVNARAL